MQDNQPKKRGKASKIDLLPEALKKELDALLRDKSYSQADILAAINERISEQGLGDEKKISRSGLSRYSMEMEAVGAEVRAMREATEAWVAQFGEKPTGETAQLLLEMLRTQHFKLLMQANADPDMVLDAKTINALALALQRLESAAMLTMKREKEIKKAFAEEAAEEIEKTALMQGATAEGAKLFRETLLGMVQ
ncbi:DUF3486 family protein [Thalassotalea euphylliae]|uniref:DUF3486 family protein n=2 Tax=Thalassotalea euphylliae TaxID=1655234 RepID=A0A3E0U7I4_9GAMM|nr:DUF3486 family protein [Thalassotalea euphylliae]